MHCCYTLQLLPCVWIDFIAAIKTCVTGLAFAVIVAVDGVGEVVVVVATGAAGVFFAGESRGGVEQEEAATGLDVLFH